MEDPEEKQEQQRRVNLFETAKKIAVHEIERAQALGKPIRWCNAVNAMTASARQISGRWSHGVRDIDRLIRKSTKYPTAQIADAIEAVHGVKVNRSTLRALVCRLRRAGYSDVEVTSILNQKYKRKADETDQLRKLIAL